ncbi:MAG: glycosyltransferase family 4 protein [Patescibacteria group bacterium]|nr:glycosyltransferase family 4 protein [Patescibacteria group bacterium]
MIVGIYNPYHDTLGGGEQYMFTFASYFLSKNHTVVYFSPYKNEIKEAERRFGFDLSLLRVEKSFSSKGLDLLFFYSDGSIPFSFAKKTYLVFQFPVPWVNGLWPLTFLKRMRITDVIVNSQFTKRFIDKTFFVNSKVLYPSVVINHYYRKEKENIILSVGRFTKGMNTKKHDVLISTFKRMIDDGLNGWKFVLAGGALESDADEVERIKMISKGYPISIYVNIERKELLDLYSKAMIYWHAAGYQEDENKHPERVEHFGISTIEAMASGAIPIVFPAGGQREIVKDKENGFFWKSPQDLISFSILVLKDKSKQEEIAKNSQRRAKDFDRTVFFSMLSRMFV